VLKCAREVTFVAPASSSRLTYCFAEAGRSKIVVASAERLLTNPDS